LNTILVFLVTFLFYYYTILKLYAEPCTDLVDNQKKPADTITVSTGYTQ